MQQLAIKIDAVGRYERWDVHKFKRFREAFGSPEQFAARIPGLSSRTVRRWEDGERVPDLAQLEAVSRAFGVEITAFLSPLDS